MYMVQKNIPVHNLTVIRREIVQSFFYISVLITAIRSPWVCIVSVIKNIELQKLNQFIDNLQQIPADSM